MSRDNPTIGDTHSPPKPTLHLRRDLQPQPPVAPAAGGKREGGRHRPTTNSAVAPMEGGKPTIVTNAEAARTTPSVVAYTKSGDRLVGQIAKHKVVVNPENTFFSVRRYISRKMNEVDEESKQVSYPVIRDDNGNDKLDWPALGKQFAAEEISAQLNLYLVLLPLDGQSVPKLEKPYHNCLPTLSIRHLCQVELLTVEDLKGTAKIEQLCLQVLSMHICPGGVVVDVPLTDSSSATVEEISQPNPKDGSPGVASAIPETDLPEIVQVIRSCRDGIHKVVELLQHKFPNVSKTQLNRKVREISDFVDNHWKVKKEVLDKLGLDSSPVKSKKNKSIAMFLDKAAVEMADDKSRRRLASAWRLCTVTQVEDLKCVLRLLPVWASGIVFAAAYTQMTTTFVLQGDTLDLHVGGGFRVPAAALSVFDTLSVMLWVPLYDRLVVPLARRATGHRRGFTQLARMGAGLLVLAAAMLATGALEVARRHVVARHGVYYDTHTGAARYLPLSIFWQVPQYVVVGASEVFTLIGQIEFFYDQAPDAVRSICSGLSITSFALGN
uniref:Chromatin assembly factor 1 subunit Cac1-like C-terminal domain-containing protein n=1 Tax=Zea mays TaxID=4577 RepID=A0A804Q7W0_MAIZE